MGSALVALYLLYPGLTSFTCGTRNDGVIRPKSALECGAPTTPRQSLTLACPTADGGVPLLWKLSGTLGSGLPDITDT